MKISDIIKSDSDRIFVTDFGCFIIFTGNTLDDSQPFIRIGNWMDMPVELIPLVENIIITDDMPGNPAQEQFNIDINTQSSNRYIGSHYTLKRFLDFQKIFGLDLKNVTIVDVETDIPEISTRSLSDKDSFIGIFYRDGNFKISHKNKDLFDLQRLLSDTYNTNRVHQDLYENTKSNHDHRGNGFLSADSIPVFYSSGNYLLYMLPKDYQQVFDKYNINPRKVSAIAHPSANYLNLAAFLRWINHNGGKLTLLSDDKPQMSIIKKLFSRATLITKTFSSTDQQITPNMRAKELFGTSNLEINYKDDSTSGITLLHFNTSEGLEKILKRSADCAILPYTIFEENSLVLKSSKIPFVILEDQNPNFKKLSSLSQIPLFSDINYDFIKFESTDESLDYFQNLIQADVVSVIFAADKKENSEQIETFFNNEPSIFKRINLIALIRYFLHITNNRKIATALNKILQNFAGQNSVENLVVMNIPFVSTIILADSGTFISYSSAISHNKPKNYIPMVPVQAPSDQSHFKNGEEYRLYAQKIERDRQRLHELVQLYLNNGKTKPVRKLQKAISERKEIYKQAIITNDDISKLHINQIFDTKLLTHPLHATDESNSEKADNGKSKLVQLLRSATNIFFNNEKYRKLQIKRNELATARGLKGHAEHSNRELTLSVITYSSAFITLRSIKRLPSIALVVLLALLILLPLYRTNRLDPLIAMLHQYTMQSDPGLKNLNGNDTSDAKDTSGNTGSQVKTDDQTTGDSTKNDTGTKELPAPPTEKKDLEERLTGTENKDMIKRYSIEVSNTDILHFLNAIAKINGYRPIGLGDVMGKNPHWIYPENIFALPDGERFIVREGDSLWKIAELKLTKMAIEFHKSVEEIEKLPGGDKPVKLFDNADKNSFTETQKLYLIKLEKRFK